MFSSARLVTVALAATLLIASCGSDDGGTSSGSVVGTVTGATVTTPATTPDTTDAMTSETTDVMPDDTTASTEVADQDVAADTAAAEAGLIGVGDLPEGWAEAPAADAATTTDVDARLAECAGVDSLTSTDAQAATGTFASPDGTVLVMQQIGTKPAELDARTVIARLTNPDVLDCVATAYGDLGATAVSGGLIPDGAEIGGVTVTRLAVGSVGNATQALRVVIPVTSAGVASQVTVDKVFIRSGRSISVITFESNAEATPVETIDAITTAAAAHLPA